MGSNWSLNLWRHTVASHSEEAMLRMRTMCRGHVLWVGLMFFFLPPSSRANVYATDIYLNGSPNAGVIVPGGTLTISYILNEPATAGVSVRIYSDSNVVRTLQADGGQPGTEAGTNSLIWDGITDSGSNAAQGVYTVSITAAATGYDTWTNITDDGPNFYVNVPHGVAVNRNTNSIYYGRVFVANAYPGPGSAPGDQVGIIKCNADGSQADEGGFSSGGYSWAGNLFSPWKMAISADDTVYVDDFSGNGEVLAFDQTISTNSYLEVLQSDNYPTNDLAPQLSGLCVTGTGTNKELWMADENYLGSAGILRWQITTNGTVAPFDTGIVIAPVTNTSALSWAPWDISLDTNGFIYAIQRFDSVFYPSNVVMGFAPYQGVEETNALWTIGTGDSNLFEAYGVAVDPTATYVAVAVRGRDGGGFDTVLQTGMLNLYYATNGQFFLNLDQTGGDQYAGVAWDNVGNLYALDTTEHNDPSLRGVWRVYSPPGTNQATTPVVPFIQAYAALVPPTLSNPSNDWTGQFYFTLQGQSNVTYVIQQSPDLINWTAVATNFSPASVLPVSVSPPDTQDFYRAVANP